MIASRITNGRNACPLVNNTYARPSSHARALATASAAVIGSSVVCAAYKLQRRECRRDAFCCKFHLYPSSRCGGGGGDKHSTRHAILQHCCSSSTDCGSKINHTSEVAREEKKNRLNGRRNKVKKKIIIRKTLVPLYIYT
jgi:hypothetical protein